MGGVRARRPLEALAKRRIGTAAMLGLGLLALASPRTSPLDPPVERKS
jgi:hypothetical protein